MSLGGCAIGLALAAGGAATGFVAVGDSVAGYYACGGTATGIHAWGTNVEDPIARAFFEPWFHSLEEFAFILALSLTLFVTVGVGVGVPIYLALRGRAQQGGTRHRFYQTAILVAVVLVLLVAASVLVPLWWPQKQRSLSVIPGSLSDMPSFTATREIFLRRDARPGDCLVDLDLGRVFNPSLARSELSDRAKDKALSTSDLLWLRPNGIDLDARYDALTLIDCSVVAIETGAFETLNVQEVLLTVKKASRIIDSLGADSLLAMEADATGTLDAQEALLKVARDHRFRDITAPNPDVPLLTRFGKQSSDLRRPTEIGSDWVASDSRAEESAGSAGAVQAGRTLQPI